MQHRIQQHVNCKFGTPCHSTCLEKKKLQGFGVVAEKTFNAGDLVYEEAPLILWNSEDGQNHSRNVFALFAKMFCTFLCTLCTCTWEDWAVANRTCGVFEDGMKTQLVNVVVSGHNGRKHQLWKPACRKHFETLEKKRMQVTLTKLKAAVVVLISVLLLLAFNAGLLALSLAFEIPFIQDLNHSIALKDLSLIFRCRRRPASWPGAFAFAHCRCFRALEALQRRHQ